MGPADDDGSRAGFKFTADRTARALEGDSTLDIQAALQALTPLSITSCDEFLDDITTFGFWHFRYDDLHLSSCDIDVGAC